MQGFNPDRGVREALAKLAVQEVRPIPATHARSEIGRWGRCGDRLAADYPLSLRQSFPFDQAG